MRFPENLKKGGTIGFVAPSFGCTTVRHNLWDFDQDEDEVAVANMAAKFRNIYHKVRCADCENVF